MKKGKFITLYGINNIGKTTQAKFLVENLENAGYDAIYVKYPVYHIEPTGPFIDSVLRKSEGSQSITEEELQTWFVLNRYQYQPEILKYLNEGKIVVAEDYTGTGIAWGTAKGLSQSWLETMNNYLLTEDLAIMLEGERFIKSKEANHVHEQNDELVEKCRVVHEKLALKYNWERVRVREEKTETAEFVWDLVKSFLAKEKS